MDEILNNILKYSRDLKLLSMPQVSADYGYLVAWMKSTGWSKSGDHVGVVPAGENTISPKSNNCPIPYTVTYKLIKDCKDKDDAFNILTNVNASLDDLESYMVTDDELTAFNSYKEYTSKLLEEFNMWFV